MGITQFKFTFQGNSEKFVNEVNSWITTPEGNGYNIKLKSKFLLELHKGSLWGEHMELPHQ